MTGRSKSTAHCSVSCCTTDFRRLDATASMHSLAPGNQAQVLSVNGFVRVLAILLRHEFAAYFDLSEPGSRLTPLRSCCSTPISSLASLSQTEYFADSCFSDSL